MLESQISRGPRSKKDNYPVLEDVGLSEWPMTVCLNEFVPVDILSRGFTSSHQPEVVYPQASRVRCCQQAVDEHGEWESVIADRLIERNVVCGGVSQTVTEAAEYQKDAEQRARADECEKEAIIAPPHTIIDPDAVMVYCLHAVVTYTAVMTPRWTPNVARFAVLCWHIHGCIDIAGRLNHGPCSSFRA